MCNQIFTDFWGYKSLSHSDRWNETCFNDQCNVLIVSIFAIYLQKSGSPRLPNGNFETYDEDVWYKAAENLGEMMEKLLVP